MTKLLNSEFIVGTLARPCWARAKRETGRQRMASNWDTRWSAWHAEPGQLGPALRRTTSADWPASTAHLPRCRSQSR
jgi:hypothetical protein